MSTDGAAVNANANANVIPSESTGSAPSSPKNRVKILCSHGGKIVPRPGDAHLKYVGGETRVISVPRDIPFQELMKKLTYLIDGEMTLKYQLVSDDLDALVTVRTDEDLRHMWDEVERYENAGIPRLRTFLFPSSPIVLENQIGSVDPHALEQRYIDAINGITRYTPNSMKQHPAFNTVQQGSLVSSGCTSPRSPDSCTNEAINNEAMLHGNYVCNRINMHRVQSSPSICGLNGPQQNSHYIHQQLLPQYVNHYPGYLSPRLPMDPHRAVGPERLTSVRSVGRAEGVKYQVDLTPQYYHSVSRQNRGSSTHYDEYGHCSDRRVVDRMSPVPLSPRFGHGGMRAWDGTMGSDS